MKRIFATAALFASLSVGTSAYAGPTIDGTVSPGEYSAATVTHTPYNPGSDITLGTFSNGNENVAETTYFQVDPNNNGFDFAVQTNPAGAGEDNADASLGEQFTNVYFGNALAGAQVVFELGNSRAVNLNTGAIYNYASSLGVLYADVMGTSYANGGIGSTSEAYIPFAAYNTILTNLGITPPAVGDSIQVRDLQAFSYGGNNAGGGNRFGSITVPAMGAVPEPATWAMMLFGIGMIGVAMRSRQNVAIRSADGFRSTW